MKVKAHNEKQVLTGQMDVKNFLGNLLADAGASVAAEVQRLGLREAEEDKWAALTYLIARRLVDIELNRKAKLPDVVPLQSKDMRFVRKLQASEARQEAHVALRARAHNLYTMGSFTYCTKCKKRRKAIGNDWWMQQPCVDGENEDLVSLGEDSSASECGEVMVSKEKRAATRAAWAKERINQRRANRTTERDAAVEAAQDVLNGAGSVV